MQEEEAKKCVPKENQRKTVENQMENDMNESLEAPLMGKDQTKQGPLMGKDQTKQGPTNGQGPDKTKAH